MLFKNRKCEVCKVNKPYKSYSSKYYSKCRSCYNLDRKVYYHKNHGRELEKAKEYRENNRNYIRKYDRKYKKKEIDDLNDKYIIKLLKKNHPPKDITKDMIKRKREYLIRLREKSPIGIIYVISDTNKIKIGFSVNYKRRLKDIQNGNPNKLKIIDIIENKTQKVEKKMHEHLKNNHSDLYVRGEWYEKKILKHYNKYIGE